MSIRETKTGDRVFHRRIIIEMVSVVLKFCPNPLQRFLGQIKRDEVQHRMQFLDNGFD
jgi:hypothetical protein